MRAGVGGRVEFTQLTNGMWFVSRWSIRMPRVATQVMTGFQSPSGASPVRARTVVGVEVTGGAVQTLRANGRLLYQGPGTALPP